MADYERLMSAMLGRRNPLLDQWYATPPATLGGDDVGRRPNALMPYSEFDTPGDLQQRREANPPLGQHNLLDRALRSFGQPMYDATVGGIEGRVSPEEGAWTLLTQGPMGPFGMARAPSSGGLMNRLSELPQAQPREFLPSDFPIQRSGSNWRVNSPNGYGGIEGVADPATRTFRILGSSLERERQGQGVGSAMYRRLIDEAHRLGYTVQSDASVSGSATRIYDALAERGYQVQRHPAATVNSLGGLSLADDALPVFTVLPPLPPQ